MDIKKAFIVTSIMCMLYSSMSYSMGEESLKAKYKMLFAAIDDGNTYCIKKLAISTELNEQINLQRGAPLHYAVGHGNSEVVRTLIASGANVNIQRYEDGSTPLHIAARCGLYTIVKILLEAGADCTIIDAQYKTPIQLVSEKLQPEKCTCGSPFYLIERYLFPLIDRCSGIDTQQDLLRVFHLLEAAKGEKAPCALLASKG